MDVEVLLRQIEHDEDADCYIYAGPVAPGSERDFNECLAANKQRDNVVCFITTHGGSADVAYQMVRAIRRNYARGKFVLFVDSICKSAGTLIALGADEIVMSDTAELGPLDIQLQKPGELGEFLSGLTATQALSTIRVAAFEVFESQFLDLRFKSGGAISTKLAAELAVKLAVGLFRPIYAQFDPMRLGEHTRSNKIAQAYGERIKTANVKDETLHSLINSYPSHGFVIDREEASRLFNCVRRPTESQHNLGKVLWEVCRNALGGDEPLISPLKGETGEHDGTKESESCEHGGEEVGPTSTHAESPSATNEPEGRGSASQETSGGGPA